VKVAKSPDEVREWAGKILGMMLKTHQTGPEGQKVRRLLVEEGADIKKELYVGMVVDRGTQRVALMASSEGGMDIEEVALRRRRRSTRRSSTRERDSRTPKPMASRRKSAFPPRACRRRARS